MTPDIHPVTQGPDHGLHPIGGDAGPSPLLAAAGTVVVWIMSGAVLSALAIAAGFVWARWRLAILVGK